MTRAYIIYGMDINYCGPQRLDKWEAYTPIIVEDTYKGKEYIIYKRVKQGEVNM